jgi:hypothetical protein
MAAPASVGNVVDSTNLPHRPTADALDAAEQLRLSYVVDPSLALLHVPRY